MSTMTIDPSLNGHPLSAEDAERILQPYFDILNQCINDGWEAWRTEYAEKAHILDARARASIVYCEIVYRAKAAFANLPGVKAIMSRGMLKVYIGDHITLRFKKMGKYGRASNIMTHQQTIFMAQLQIPGILSGTLVHAGYQLDDLQAEIVRKAVVCQLDKQVIWQIEISGEAALLIPMPSPDTPQIPSTEPRFIAKGQHQEKPKEAEGGTA